MSKEGCQIGFEPLPNDGQGPQKRMIFPGGDVAQFTIEFDEEGLRQTRIIMTRLDHQCKDGIRPWLVEVRQNHVNISYAIGPSIRSTIEEAWLALKDSPEFDQIEPYLLGQASKAAIRKIFGTHR